MIAEGPDGQQGILEPWKKMCLSGLKRRVPAQDGLFALILWYIKKTLY